MVCKVLLESASCKTRERFLWDVSDEVTRKPFGSTFFVMNTVDAKNSKNFSLMKHNFNAYP